MGMRAPPASRYKGAGRRPDGGTGIRTSRNKTYVPVKQNEINRTRVRAPTRTETNTIGKDSLNATSNRGEGKTQRRKLLVAEIQSAT